jgi:predicted PurR-regulated permease PerM
MLPPRLPQTPALTGGRVAIGIVAAIAAAAAARELGSILVPLVIAIFLAILVETIARVLRRTVPALPRGAGLAVGALALAVALVGSVWIVGAYAASLVGQAAAVSARLDAILTQLALRAGTSPISLDRLVGEEQIKSVGGMVLTELQGFATGVLFVAIYLGFLLASRRSLTLKFGRLFAPDGQRPNARRVLNRVRDATEQYVWVQTVTGVVIAGASWALMAAVGLSNAPLLAFIIFLTSYIPVVGPFLGVFIPPLVGLAEFDGWARPIILLVGLQAINFAINNVIVPRMQSDRLNLDPIVVLLSLGFWTWLWGLPGAFLSTPLTALVMAITAEIPSVRWIAVLLSRDGEPTASRPD